MMNQHQYSTLRRWIAAGVLTWCAAMAGAEAPRGLPALAIPDSFGVNIHFTRADAPQLERLAASGNRFIRMDFGWGGTERKKGEYDFAAYDRLVADMSKIGIRCLFILDYGNRLYDEGQAPHSPEAQAAFARWTGAAARHFAGKGILWEIWNEPNLAQFWKPKPNAEDYCRLAHATIDAIRSADPDAFIMAPASSEFPWDFFEVMGRQGIFRKLDAVSVHPYRQRIPETAEADYCRLRVLLEKHAPGKNLPIVSGEWGYSTAWAKIDEEKQANYIVRQRLMNLWMGVPLSIWYDWHDDGSDPKEPEHHFGTVYRDFKPKPSYIAGKTLAETLSGYRFVRRVAEGTPKDYVLLFGREKAAALTVWTTDEPHALKLKIAAQSVTLVSRDGQRRTIQPEGGIIELQVGAAPQYVLFEDSPTAPILIGGPAATMNILAPGREPSIPLAAANTSDSGRHRGMVSLPDLSSDRTLTEVRVPDASGPSSWVWLLNPNPLHIAILPPAGQIVPVIVDNPSAQPIRLSLRLASGSTSATAPLTLSPGQQQAILRFSLPEPPGIDSQLSLEGYDQSNRRVLQPNPVRWRATTPPQAPGQWRASIEGDAKIAAQAQVTVANAKPMLPQPGLAKAINLAYQFGNGWRYIAVMPPKEQAAIEGKPKTLGLWVHGDGSGNVLRCRFNDSTGQTFQPTYGPITWTGWKWITLPLDGADAGSWGGAKDGIIHYPIHWDAVLLIDNMKDKIDQPLTIQATGFALGY